MNVGPFSPQLLVEWAYFCDRFGPLPFDEFVAMWQAADEFMEAATDAGFEPHELSDLLITADNPRMEFIRSTDECIRPNIGRMRPRGVCIRRWRSFRRARPVKPSSRPTET